MVRVVAVEDDRDIANFLKVALSFIGDLDIRIVTSDFRGLVGNGQWDGVDALLTDWNLGDFPTEELLYYLMKEKPHVKRIVLTAHFPSDIPQECADAIISKPASLDKIAQTILAEVNRGGQLAD